MADICFQIIIISVSLAMDQDSASIAQLYVVIFCILTSHLSFLDSGKF